MKRVIVFLAIFAMLGGAVSAQGMSIGGGVLIDTNMGNGLTLGNAGIIFGPDLNGIEMKIGEDITSFGAFFFVDYDFLMVDMSLAFGKETYFLEALGIRDTIDAGSYMSLGFSIFGKYPINMGLFTIFPLVGINYNMVISYEYQGTTYTDASEWLSQIGILGGAGIDFPLGDLFLRGEALVSYRLPMKTYNEQAKLHSSISANGGIGFRLKVEIGMKL